MTEISARQRDFFDRQVISLIKMKYGMEDMKAIRSFLFSETYQMLLDPLTEVYTFSPQIVFEMWESEMITGNPRNSQYIRGEENEERRGVFYLSFGKICRFQKAKSK